MGIDGGALISLLKPLIDRAQPEWKKEQQGLKRRFDAAVETGIADHHVYVVNWCQEAHTAVIGVSPDAPTVELSFNSIPRRLGVGGRELEELDLLTADGHVAVLGDPGAGKTTTLRRLCRWVALEPPADSEDDWKFAVVVVCRDEDWSHGDNPLYRLLGRKLGIEGRLFDDLDSVESRIREILDVGALILIDGLDEVPARVRDEVEKGITNLGRHLRRARIVLSCRSGDYVSQLGGFTAAEIKPLSAAQVRDVTEALLDDGEVAAFNVALSEGTHPAADLANRPLFLMYMLAIFKRRGTVPERPVDLYEAITRLIIQEWDEQRGIRRTSRYAEFGVDDKRRFLADLAYELIRRNRLRFDENELASVYTVLSERYGLPKHEARTVARELESHTGLLVQSGEFFEFSHLSLQEFLAADALVRGGSAARVDWWNTHPEVAAVAVALSSDANQWFQDLIAMVAHKDLDDTRGVRAFLHRLGRERPRFVRADQLGRSFLQVLFRCHVRDADVVTGLRDLRPVRDSVADALGGYTVTSSGGVTRLVQRHAGGAGRDEALSVSTEVLSALVGGERLRQTIGQRPSDRS